MDAAGGTSALLVARGPCGPEEVKVFVDADNRVQRIGKDLDPSACAGEFIGIARFDSATGAALAHNLEQCAAADQSGQFFEFSLNQILARHAICAAFIDRNDAIEIDTPEDYETAKCMWSSP
jgi:choline kinase